MTKKTQYCYYLGLYDIDIIDHIDKNGVNIYKKVDWRKSGNQEYFVMIRKKLTERGNWYELNDKQVLDMQLIDFCFSNWAKLQTNSVIHNRILLDTCHFISNKLYYYETFKNYEFIPSFTNITDVHKLPETISEKLILKPSTGSLSIGIKILDNTNTKTDIIKHLRFYKEYTNWTLSTLYIAKRWMDGCIVSNRIYYLVRKFKKNNQLYITGYWFDELIHYKAPFEYNPNETNYASIKKQLLTNCANGETTARDFFDKRVLTHEQYLKLFTETEYNSIKEKFTNYLHIITKKITEHITCSNDYLDNLNDTTGENKNMSFHLYGIDSLIMDDLKIKFIEINGAPAIIHNAALNHIDYTVMIDEILKLTTDILYPPNPSDTICNDNNICNDNDKILNDKVGPKYGYFKDSNDKVKLFDRKFINCGEFIKYLKTPIYIAKEITDVYPFICNALFNPKRTQLYQRIKNPHSNDIFLFYGLRDRYIHKQSSLQFYDEILEYRVSGNGRNAKIINKIQGITYFLASKDRLYNICEVKDYMPASFIFNIDSDNPELLNTFIERHNNIRLIIKPVYGSQGKGIVIMAQKSSLNMFITNMKWIKTMFGYNIFIISIYIDNPKLYTDTAKFKYNIKFNLRFYALLHINKLACYDNNVNDINYYILNDVQIYFSILPYNLNINEITTTIMSILNLKDIDNYIKIYDKIKKLSLDDISNLTNLTNLQIVKNLSSHLNMPIDLNNFVMTLDNMNYDLEFKKYVMQQGEYIITDTIQSVKNNIRHLNRFVPDSSAFNLIAYDTMLDDNNKLHLIEINRGPDLHGLVRTLGEGKVTDIFCELFDIVIENKDENDLKYFQKYKLMY
jgi:glutathione synthase/RimK-type ligase-like ATP-grasp enzyme